MLPGDARLPRGPRQIKLSSTRWSCRETSQEPKWRADEELFEDWWVLAVPSKLSV